MNGIQIIVNQIQIASLLYLATNQEHLIGILVFIVVIVVICYMSVFRNKKKIGRNEGVNKQYIDKNKEERNEKTK